MYASFINRNKNKKKETKHTSLRSTSTRPSAPPFPSSSRNSLAEPIHSFRSTSQSPTPVVPYSRAQSLKPPSVADNSPSLSHTFPHPINSPIQNTGNYSWYSYSRADHQWLPVVQGDYSQHNQQQQHQDSWVVPSPRPSSAIVSPVPTVSVHIDYRAKQYESPPKVNARLQAVAAKYKICDALTQRLCMLEQFEIVLLCDDSGSMNTPLEGTHKTRWDELQAIVNIIIEISVVLDSNGVDVHFLNRDAVFNITDPRHIYKSFAAYPVGATPLTPALRRIFQLESNNSNRKKHLLVFVATDGEPTDSRANVDIPSLERLMLIERQSDKMHVVFLTCTDDKSSVAYLSQWDRTMVNVDVIDDYKTEREEIRQIRGPRFPFSFGDYIAKALLGAVDPQMDSLDEPANNYHNNRS